MAVPSPPRIGHISTAQQASVSDILTALKNLVTAFNNNTQTLLQINGANMASAIAAATVVKAAPGRIVSVSITTAGSSTGAIYDAAATGVTNRPLWVIPETAASNGEPYLVNLPAAYGILVVPGTGQTVAVSYS